MGHKTVINTLALARALLSFDAMHLRELAFDAVRMPEALAHAAAPETAVKEEQAAAAAIVELLCMRLGIEPPAWTVDSPVVDPPRHVVAAALRMPRLNALCELESPPAMRRRGFYAPPDFLSSV